jgi:type IV pilus assembly protein PilB
MNIADILVEKGKLAKADVAALLEEAASSGSSVEQVLLGRGITPEEILEAKGEYLSVPTKSLDGLDIPTSVLDLVPEESARHYSFLPLALTDGVLEVGLVDPDNIEARDALNFIASKAGVPFRIFLISQADFDQALGLYKGLSGEVNKALSALETELDAEIKKKSSKDKKDGEAGDLSETVEGDEELANESKIDEEAPVTKIVATILRYATDGNASDIHIEPQRETVKVRFRVDGVLNTSIVLPIKVHSAVVARIKILSNMRLDEKRKPQDGRFSAKIEGRKIDFRVSTFPTYFGEKVVMRLLDQEKGVKKMDELGLSTKNLAMIRKAVTRPYGLILISGPTGSGKTSTLYSMLTEVDREHQNVLSLEDPIEYNIAPRP